MGVCAFWMGVIVLVCMCVCMCMGVTVLVCMCMYVHGYDRNGMYVPRHACIGQRTLPGVCSLLPLETGSLVSAASPSFPG